MATNTPDESLEDFQENLETLMMIFAGFVWRGTSAEEAVGQIAKYGATLAPTIAAMVAESAQAKSFFHLLGRNLWNATPQPAHGFRLLKLAEPGRNDPCFCGSLRKYKQCCAEVSSLPIDPELMLWHLLKIIPRKQWHTLAHSHINRDWVLSIADQMREDGDYESAVQLLEPWFKGDGTIPDQDAELLDMLLGTYLQLDKQRKRKSLAQAAIARGGREVKYVGWQRLTLMEIDAGNLTAARNALNEAMRTAPDNPDLALLEIQCLLAEGKDHIAQERAKFWHAKTAKLHDPAFKERLDWLLAISKNPRMAMFDAIANHDETLKMLEEQIQAIGAPQCHYILTPAQDSTGPFEPDKALAKALKIWEKTFPVTKPLSTTFTTENFASWDDNPHAWLAVLQANPILWHSFDVLDDVVNALDNHIMTGVADILNPLLLSRAEALFDKVISEHNAADLKCEWGWAENRPALRLLVRKALDNQSASDPAKREAAFCMMHRLVETLNPHDNHGLRTMVVAGLVMRDKADEAIALAAKYPNDFANMEFTRALALYAAGRIQEAEQVALLAHTAYPRVGKMLVAASPRQPKIEAYGYPLGSPQEAWIYRESFLDAWKTQNGALDWLSKVLRKR